MNKLMIALPLNKNSTPKLKPEPAIVKRLSASSCIVSASPAATPADQPVAVLTVKILSLINRF